MNIVKCLLQFEADKGSLGRAKQQVQSELNGISAKVNFQIDPRADAEIKKLTASMTAFRQATVQSTAAVNQFGSALTSAASSGNPLSALLTRISAQAAAATTALTALTAAATSAGTGAATAGGGFGAGAIGLGLFTVAIRRSIDEALQFDRAMVSLVQVADAPAGAVRGLEKDITRLSTSLGISSLDLVRSSNVILQAGYSLNDTKKIMESVGKASLAPNFRNMGQISEAVISMRQFGVSVDEVEGKLGSMNAVAGAFAVEASDLVTTLQKSGGAAKASGFSFEELMATFTSVRNTTRESADSIATGLKTVFGRLQRADTVESLHQLGIELRYTRAEAEKLGNMNLEGQFRGGFSAIKKISEGLANTKTTDPRFASVVESLGGTRQLSKVLPLLTQQADAERALQVAIAGRSSVEIAASQAQDAHLVKLQKAREEINALTRSVVDGKGFSVLVSGLQSAAEAGSKLVQSLGPLLPIIAGLAAVRLGGAMGLSVGGVVTRGRVLGGAGLLAASAAPDIIDSFAGKSQTGSAIGGGLQGGAAGALVGSMFGPWGTALGGAVGAIAGFTSALTDSKDAILRSKMDSDLTLIGQRLTDAKAGNHPSDLPELLSRTRKNIEQRAASDSTSTLGNLDGAKYGAKLREGNLKELGPLIIPIVETLSRRAEQAGRNAPDTSATSLHNQFSKSNIELIKTLGTINKQSPEQASAQFMKIIEAAQSDKKNSSLSIKVEDDSLRLTAAFSRLVTSVERANQSIAGMSQQGAALSALGEGFRPANPLPIDPHDPATLARLVSPLGGAGAPLLRSAEAGKQIKNILPGILAQIASSSPLEGSAPGAEVRSMAVKSLGGKVNADQSAALDAVVESINRHKDVGEFRRSVSASPDKEAEEALSRYTHPIEQTAQHLARMYADAGQKIADGLNTAASKLNTAGDSLDKVYAIGLAGAKVRAGILSEKTGKSAADFLSFDQLQAPFREQQNRLAGPLAGNVGAIGLRLAENRKETLEATKARDAAIGTPQAFETANNLSKLAVESDNLVQSLKHLADTSEQNASINEKLAQSTANRDGRLSYAERWYTASSDQKHQMFRGASIVRQLDNNQVQFKNLPASQQKLAIEQMNMLSNVVLASGRTGLGLKNQILGNTGVLDKKQEDERGELQKKQEEIYAKAQEAQKALAEFQKQNQVDFFKNLSQSHDLFLARLAAELTAGKVSSQKAEATSTATSLQDVKTQISQRDSVSAMGIPFQNKDDLERVKTYRDLLGEFSGKQAELNTFLSDRQKLRGSNFAGDIDEMGGLKFNSGSRILTPSSDESLNRVLQSKYGLDSDSSQRVVESTGRFFLQKIFARKLDANDKNPEMVEKVKQAYNDSVKAGLSEVTQSQFADKQKPVVEMRRRLTENIPGIVPEKINSNSLESLDKAIITFGQTGASLESLDARLQSSIQAHDKATEALAVFERAARLAADAANKLAPPVSAPTPGGKIQQAPGFASGGPVGMFKPKGRDVIPAMLAKDEFVINPESSRANASLLKKINGAKGPLYRADGGTTDESPEDRRNRILGAKAARPDSDFTATIGKYEVPPTLTYATDPNSFIPNIADNILGGVDTGLEKHARQANKEAWAIIHGEAQRDPNGPTAIAKKAWAVGNKMGPFRPDEQEDKIVKAVLPMQRAMTSQSLMYEQMVHRSDSGLPGAGGQLKAAGQAISEHRKDNTDAFREEFGEHVDWLADRQKAVRQKLPLPKRIVKPKPELLPMPKEVQSPQVPRSGITVRRYAEGGLVGGHESGDKQRALLESGEYVIPKDVVRSQGLSAVRHFAQGGLVGGDGTSGGASSGGAAGGLFGMDPSAMTAIQSFGTSSKELGQSFTGFGRDASGLSQALLGFTQNSSSLTAALIAFPHEVSHKFDGQTQVFVHGLDVLAAVEEKIQSVVRAEIAKEFSARLPDAPSSGRSDPSRLA